MACTAHDPRRRMCFGRVRVALNAKHRLGSADIHPDARLTREVATLARDGVSRLTCQLEVGGMGEAEIRYAQRGSAPLHPYDPCAVMTAGAVRRLRVRSLHDPRCDAGVATLAQREESFVREMWKRLLRVAQ